MFWCLSLSISEHCFCWVTERKRMEVLIEYGERTVALSHQLKLENVWSSNRALRKGFGDLPPGPCAAGMLHPSLHGRIHSVSRGRSPNPTALPQVSANPHCKTKL